MKFGSTVLAVKIYHQVTKTRISLFFTRKTWCLSALVVSNPSFSRQQRKSLKF